MSRFLWTFRGGPPPPAPAPPDPLLEMVGGAKVGVMLNKAKTLKHLLTASSRRVPAAVVEVAVHEPG